MRKGVLNTILAALFSVCCVMGAPAVLSTVDTVASTNNAASSYTAQAASKYYASDFIKNAVNKKVKGLGVRNAVQYKKGSINWKKRVFVYFDAPKAGSYTVHVKIKGDKSCSVEVYAIERYEQSLHDLDSIEFADGPDSWSDEAAISTKKLKKGRHWCEIDAYCLDTETALKVWVTRDAA